MKIHKLIYFLLIWLSINQTLANSVINIIRDDEIESAIYQLISPLLQISVKDPSAINIIIVNDKTVNAYTTDTSHIFINSGLLTKFFDDPDLLLGIIAHELAHIFARHGAKINTSLNNIGQKSLASSMILGALAIASSNPSLLLPILDMNRHIAERSLMLFSRQHEQAADQIACKFLEQSGNSAIGLKTALEYLRNHSNIDYKVNPNAITHPLISRRLAAINHHLQMSKYKVSTINTKIRSQYQRAMIKLSVFLAPNDYNLNILSKKNNNDYLYAHAIKLFLNNKQQDAMNIMDQLITLEPENPYFYELKAQILYENGMITSSITNYQKAYELKPSSELISYEYALAINEGVDIGKVSKNKLDQAIMLLKKNEEKSSNDISNLTQLSRAYGKKGNIGVANYYIAKASFLLGDIIKAKRFASLACKSLYMKDPYYLKSQDILSTSISD